MALGGGTFLVQNKRLPGAYINTVSVASASATLSDRGYAALPLEMDWGPQGEIFTVEQGNFLKNSQKLFGYPYTSAALRPMREVFCHAKTVHFFRLGSSGVKASCTFGSAKYPGIRGNALRVVITASEGSTEQAPRYDVETFLDTQKVETQEDISTAAELADNDFVVWKDDAVLALTASTPLTGGTNGTVEDGNYQTFLDAIESRTFNALGCTSTNDTIKKLFAAFTERMRNDVGKKFQCIGFRYLADDEGVISLKNTVTDEGADPAALIPWVVGVAAGTAVNKSATNMVYDGEYTPDTRYTQTQLEAGIQEGSFMLHDVDGETRVLSDINTFVSITDEKGADFSSNQTIRVLDQIANDIAVLFGTKYLGKVPNDGAGRISLWNDIVSHHQKLQAIRALEDFDPEGIIVEKGESKKSVAVSDHVTPVNAMEQLYMTVYVN